MRYLKYVTLIGILTIVIAGIATKEGSYFIVAGVFIAVWLFQQGMQ